eukprot:2232841-Pyramimonas_sp.AAC.1
MPSELITYFACLFRLDLWDERVERRKSCAHMPERLLTEGVCGTQAAMATGSRAANQVVQAIRGASRSRL